MQKIPSLSALSLIGLIFWNQLSVQSDGCLYLCRVYID